MTDSERCKINMMICQIVDFAEDLEQQFYEGHVDLTLKELYEARAEMTVQVLAQYGFTRNTTPLHTNN